MNIEKAFWATNGDNIHISLPFSKVDVENRLVSGFASMDNLDKHDDIVTAEASIEAFKEFRGNLREMHQHIAVGRVVSFNQEPYYDAETQKFYNGTYVTAYVSQGAPDTWTKVLDGTLTGFSIGGKIVDSEPVFDSSLNKSIRIVHKMQLHELSLVDNPANQFANILSITKVDGELVFKGLAIDVDIENVFWCATCKYAKMNKNENSSCANCSAEMENIGWVECGSDAFSSIEKVVAAFLNKSNDSSGLTELPDDEGGVDMSEEIEKEAAAATVEEAAVVDEVEAVVEDVPVEDVEKTSDAEDVQSELDIVKMIDDFKTFVAGAVEASNDLTNKSVNELRASVDELKTTFDSYKAQIADEIKEVTSQIGSVGETAKDITKRLGDVEDLTATKKSGDLGGEPEVTNKSVWSGTFLGVDTLID
jgi:hypothetical protein